MHINRGGDEALDEQLRNFKEQIRRKDEQLEQQSRELSSIRSKVKPTGWDTVQSNGVRYTNMSKKHL